jgi:superoxide dismutase, Cu-Zn family
MKLQQEELSLLEKGQQTEMNRILFFILSPLLFLSCTDTDRSQEIWQEKQSARILRENIPNFTEAAAVLHPTEGNNVRGIVRFIRKGNNIEVHAEVEGLNPNSKHGFHIHEFGDCSASDAESAGGHFNPFGGEHGSPDIDNAHAGDLGNLESDSDGRATFNKTFSHFHLWGSHSIIGRSVLIHQDEDDLTSQPAGNAGARIACGVIGGIREYTRTVDQETQ